MKILFGVLTVMFILFAGLQYNDPDPYIWIPYYLGIAVLTGAMVNGRFLKWFVVTMTVASIVGLVHYFPGVYDWEVNHNAENIAQQMKADKPYIEKTREFFGIAISLAAIALVYWKGKKR